MSRRYTPFADLWEGISTADFTLEQVRRRAALLARTLHERGWSCLVAADTRFMSSLFALDIVQHIAGQGVVAKIAAAPCPLPAVQYAIDRQVANCALVISARNRPYWYNGMVLVTARNQRLQFEAGPWAQPTETPTFPPTTFAPPLDQTCDLRGPYLDYLRAQVDIELIRRVSLTFFVDAMSGTSAGFFPALLQDGGQTRAIEINKESDPLFGRVAPLPLETGVNRLRKLVRESDSHLGLAVSADGMALGLVEKNGDLIDPAEMALLLGAYLSRQQRLKGTVVIPPPAASSPIAAATPKLAAWEEALGFRVEISTDPSVRISELMQPERVGLLVGCSSEGEIIIGKYGACPDGVLAGLLLVEMAARNGGNLRGLIEALREPLLKL